MEEAKQELKDVVEFLRDPERFKRLGGKMPTGELSSSHGYGFMAPQNRTGGKLSFRRCSRTIRDVE